MKEEDVSELILPESKEVKGYLIYFKIIFIPVLLYIFILLGYFERIDFKVELHTVVMNGIILLVALFFARHNAEYAYNIFEQQKNEFKQALKKYIMKHFLTIGKDTKSNASFDDFAYSYIKGARNSNIASIGSAIFPMLGILGTFISIAISMPNFNSSNTQGLEQEIANLLSGVGTAFYVSIYGIFLAIWWIFFEKFGMSKIQRLINRQKISTSGFFWTKAELDQKYLQESLQHFDKIGAIFKQISNDDFFAELDIAIDRKFQIFQNVLNNEEKAIRVSSEYIKQTMNELAKAQREQKDIAKLYSEMINAIGILNQNIKEVNTRMSEQYNRLLDISNEKIQHFDKTISNFDEKIEIFQNNFEKYENSMLESQEKVFNGFKDTLFEGMSKFKEIYENERSVEENLNIINDIKEGMEKLNKETSEVIEKLDNDLNNSSDKK